MEQLNHKVGDTVRIKSEDWYNQNCDEHGNIFPDEPVPFFCGGMDEYCGQTATIVAIYYGKKYNYYVLDIDNGDYMWTEFMFEN